jgi:hypothetical protein
MRLLIVTKPAQMRKVWSRAEPGASGDERARVRSRPVRRGERAARRRPGGRRHGRVSSAHRGRCEVVELQQLGVWLRLRVSVTVCVGTPHSTSTRVKAVHVRLFSLVTPSSLYTEYCVAV